MKIRIYSDLHTEFHRFDPPPLDASIDLVILAGDIDKKPEASGGPMTPSIAPPCMSSVTMSFMMATSIAHSRKCAMQRHLMCTF